MGMRLHRANQSQLLRRIGAGHCKYCGTRVEWFDRYDTQRIPLTPEVPTSRVPERFRWHLYNGIAYPGADPRSARHCRLPHPAVCPALEHTDLPPELTEVVTRLGVMMNGRITRGEFVPAPVPTVEEEVSEPDPGDRDAAEADGLTRHTLHYASTLRLAPCRIEDVRCIAAVEDGERCPNSIFLVDEGFWEQVDLPHAPGREGQTILSRTDGRMWVWSLKPADFTVVSRWLKQRCPDHEGHSAAPDHSSREWTAFHPLRHADYIVTERPEGYDPPPVHSSLTVHDGPQSRRQCAADGCYNSTVGDAEDGWMCWRCTKLAKRREQVNRRWQNTGRR
jgi:hypothetical protein